MTWSRSEHSVIITTKYSSFFAVRTETAGESLLAEGVAAISFFEIPDAKFLALLQRGIHLVYV